MLSGLRLTNIYKGLGLNLGCLEDWNNDQFGEYFTPHLGQIPQKLRIKGPLSPYRSVLHETEMPIYGTAKSYTSLVTPAQARVQCKDAWIPACETVPQLHRMGNVFVLSFKIWSEMVWRQ